jgi:signal transduction histidine kinase/ActR/RegA family two-component response regulator
VDAPVPVAESARTRKRIIVSSVEERDRRYPVLARVHGVAQGGAVTTFPLFASERLLGVLGLCFPSSRNFDEHELALLQTLADQCAFAVERARLHELSEREIGERRRSEAALEEAAKRKDEFIAMLAHELRNPLAPIRHAAEALSAPQLGAAQRARLTEIIMRQSGHMTRLVDDLLDVSRITRGRLELKKQKVCLGDLVRATVNDQKPVFERAGIRLTVSTPEHPLWALVDDTRVVQALSNVLHNSLKFCVRGGSVHVDLTIEAETSVRLSVVDDGLGMAPHTVTQAFESFAQADQTLSRSRGGLGLGLAVVKGVIELHGGQVLVESEGLGKGTSVSIWLPVEPVRTRSSAPPVDATSLGRRILLIEDNAQAAEALSMLLELFGHEVQIAGDGSAGVALFERFSPDVVLSDIGLPGEMDGYAVARALRERAKNPSDLMLIALSGYGQDRDKERALAAGFDAHLTKPVDHATLELMLRQDAESH